MINKQTFFFHQKKHPSIYTHLSSTKRNFPTAEYMNTTLITNTMIIQRFVGKCALAALLPLAALAGEKTTPASNPTMDDKDEKAFCRFVPERLDDFAWENDRIAFRMYGPKMWTIPAKRCSSGVDVWVKKVRYPIIDKWYKRGNYHQDKGEGADFYAVGKTLGCGGLGFWSNDKLHLNRHYVSHKVIKGEGDRIEFELTYAPLEIDGTSVTESKRISMETGSNLFKVQNTFRISGGGSVMAAVGIVLREGDDDLRHGKNWIGYAEPPSPKDGQTYCGLVLENPAEFKKTDGHALLLVPVNDGDTLTYRAGAAWSQGLDFKNGSEWMTYLQNQAESVSATPQKQAAPQTPDYFAKVDLAQSETSEYFKNWPAGKSPAEIGKKVSENFLPRGHYQDFNRVVYPEICTWYGAFRIARLTGDNALAEKLVRRFDPYLNPKNAKRFPNKFHVDYGVHGVIPLEIYRLTKDEKYKNLGMKRADHQWEKPTADGITRQARYWVDDIYMISAIQTSAHRVTGEMKYLDRAALTTATYIEKLQQPDGLFFHAADSPFYWGRGVGWFAAGMTEILRALPEDHPHYAPIMKGYKKMMSALAKHQSESGLWRQLVDKPEAWEETSSTGMYVYAMVTGVKRGWLDEQQYGPVARKGWLGLVDMLDDKSNMKNVCVGTNKAAKMVGNDLDAQYEYYLARPSVTGDYHGQAPLLWSAAAMLE